MPPARPGPLLPTGSLPGLGLRGRGSAVVRRRLLVIERLVRAIAGHEHACAAGLFGLVVLVYLWPVLVGGRVFSADAALYSVAPWSHGAPLVEGQYNKLLSDIPAAYYPWDVFERRALGQGILPTWNNLVLAGTPVYTNPQTGALSVVSLPLWLLPLGYALGLVAAIKLWLAGFGTYLLVRQLGLRFWPGMLAAVSFAFCSFNIGWLAHQTLPAVAAWLPWTLLLVERVMTGGRRGNVLGLAVVSALVIDGGHPGTELHVFLAAAVYGLVRMLTIPGITFGERTRRLVSTAGGMVLGALLMAVIVIPVIEAGSSTMGQSARAGGGETLPVAALKTALFPDWWGNPGAGAYGGPLNYIERTLYTGTVALVLVGLALSMARSRRLKLPFAVLGIVGLAIPFGAPIIRPLITHLPLLDSVNDGRMILLFMLAASVLAAFGLQDLIDGGIDAARRAGVVVGLVALTGLAGVVAVHPALGDLEKALHGMGHPSEYVLGLTSIYWSLTISALVGLLLYTARRRGRRLHSRWLAVALACLATGDMLHFAHPLQTMAPVSWALPPSTTAVAFLQRHRAAGRIGALGGNLPADSAMNYGLADVRGYDPPQPSLRYLHLWRFVNPQQPIEGLTIPYISPIGLNVLRTLGMRYLLTDPYTGGRPPPKLSVAYRGPDAVIYGDTGAAPAAFVPNVVQQVAGERGSVRAITSPGFDPRRDAVVEAGQPGVSTLSAGRGTAALISDRNAAVSMTADLVQGGLVVLNDAWADGWTVRVDGHPRPLLRVNDVMRGVVVPAGRHDIRYSYAVPGLRIGATISLIALTGLVVGAGGSLVSRRRRAPAGRA